MLSQFGSRTASLRLTRQLARPVKTRLTTSNNHVSFRSFSVQFGATSRPRIAPLPPVSSRNFWWSSSSKAVAPAAAASSTLPGSNATTEPASTPVEASTTAPSDSLASSTAIPPIESVPETVSAAASTVDLPAVSDISSISDVATQVLFDGNHLGDLAALGLCNWTPVGGVQWLLEQLHVTAGMPWWVSIIAISVVTRLALAPLQLRMQVNNSRLAHAMPEVQPLMEEFKQAGQSKNQLQLMKAKKQLDEVYLKYNCHPLKGLIGPVIQLPVGISMFIGIRKMCLLPVESLKTGGAGWITDLTLADPYYILPVLSSVSMLAMIRMASADTPQNTPFAQHMPNFFAAMTAVGAVFMSFMPSGVLLYFAANGVMLGAQYLVLRVPAVREWAGILPPPRPKGAAEKKEKKKTFADSIQYARKAFGDYYSNRLDGFEKRKNAQLLATAKKRGAEAKMIKPRKN